MGLERAERLKQDYRVDLEWKAYELRSGLPPQGIPRTPKAGEMNGFLPHLSERADDLGLKLKRSPIVPCSRLVLEVAEYAKEQGKFNQFHLAVFKAYWEEAKNIGLRNIIREIVQECGLNADEVEHFLDDGRYTQVIKTQSEEAKLSGINGIPAYIIGDIVIEGVQPYQFFQKAMEAALGKKNEELGGP
ncbi:DsbA family protein [Chloroflexota bacterium]